MKPERAKFHPAVEIPWEQTGPGVQRQILGYDNQIMLVKVRFEKGCVGVAHSHFHAQSSCIASGLFEVTIDGASRVLGPGDGFYAEPNVVHGVLCLEDGDIIDCFSPVREDFLK